MRLVVNRNATQQRIARSIARMWKDNLNIDTEIVVKENSEIAATRRNQDFDILRRGVVLPVVDEAVSMSAILGIPGDPDPLESVTSHGSGSPESNLSNRSPEIANQNTNSNSKGQTEVAKSKAPLLSQDAALYELRAIPLYFPTSFALVKPYVDGFEINSLDAPLLSGVSINSDWQPKHQ